MYEPAKRLVLRLLKVPGEPHPPQGDPASVRVFRAGRNYYRFRIFGWAVNQAFALAGILLWAGFFYYVEENLRQPEVPGAAPPAATGPQPGAPTAARPAPRRNPDPLTVLRRQVRRLPTWAFPAIWAIKGLGFALYLVQIPFTYTLRRLDYELRWYMVTDRSLRVRTGIWSVREQTMSFANLQQVVVTRGPIQGLLGLSDVRVQSAGGHEISEAGGGMASLHIAHFHGVDNGDEIRDLILARLKHFRDAGLGDPDDQAPVATSSPADGGLLLAARELAAEAKALRQSLVR